jgi:hypothetical protein
MSAQTIQTAIISEEMLRVLQQLSPEQLQQVMDFAQFLAQKHTSSGAVSDTEQQGVEGQEHHSQSENWVEKASGSLKDVPEFDRAIAYGRAIRTGDDSVLAASDQA